MIASILLTGAFHEDGLPMFVMVLVEGGPKEKNSSKDSHWCIWSYRRRFYYFVKIPSDFF
jgi:hypothetical protein